MMFLLLVLISLGALSVSFFLGWLWWKLSGVANRGMDTRFNWRMLVWPQWYVSYMKKNVWK